MNNPTTRFPNPAGGLLSAPALCATSTSSLDIKAYLETYSCSILSTTGPSLSFSETFASLDDDFSQLATPPHPSASKFLATTILSTSDRAMTSNSSKSEVLVTIPTSPRVKAMLMEPICVSQWTEKLADDIPPSHTPWEGNTNDEERLINPPWVPEGSILPPDAFSAILRHRRGTFKSPGLMNKKRVASKDPRGTPRLSNATVSKSVAQRSPTVMKKSSLLLRSPDSDSTKCSPSLPHNSVPTIMVSNSAAMLPLSLESSHNLPKCAPLVIRRGTNLPKPPQLDSGEHTLDVSGSCVSTSCPHSDRNTPSSPCSNITEATSIDLSAMCNDLRSRVPPLRNNSPFRANLLETSSQMSEDDEWAFAQGLETSFNSITDDIIIQDGLCSTPAESAFVHADSSGRSGEDTLTNNEATTPSARTSTKTHECRASLPDPQKLHRRRTVIIETPEEGPRRKTRITLDLSHLDDSMDSSVEQALPLDSDALENLSFSPDKLAHSTPPRRPPSSATLRPPAKGILKEKKSVRFSVLPSMHEYTSEKEATVRKEEKSSSSHSRAPTPLGRRVSLAPRSSLRQTSLHRTNIIMESAVKDHRVSFPKHPVLKSVAKSSPPRKSRDSTATPTASKATNTASGISSKVASRPANGRTSLPMSITGNKSSQPSTVSGSVDKGTVRGLKKMRPAGTVSMPPRPRSTPLQDENVARRQPKAGSQVHRHESAPVTPKSRVPFRSMLAKLGSRTA